MVFHPLVSKIWAGTDQNGTFFDNNWRPSWMCHSDRTGCWTRVRHNRQEAISSISAQFHHMPERYERVRVGWHCAKVKGHAELKQNPRVKTLIVTTPPNYIILTPTVSVLTSTCSKYGAIPTLISGITALKKMACAIFLWSAAIFESVGRTESVFELNLALSEKRPTKECRSDSGIFLNRVFLFFVLFCFLLFFL